MMDIHNHDNNKGYRSPRAWAHAKQIFRQIANGVPELAIELEKVADAQGTCVRLMLATALNLFTKLDPSQRRAVLAATLCRQDPAAALSASNPAPSESSLATTRSRRGRDDEEGEEWKRLPTEDLPDDQKPDPGELLAVEWKILAPAWPMPALPPDARLFDGGDGPPGILTSTAPIKQLCPHCGKPYLDSAAYHRHLVAAHGWTRDDRGYIHHPTSRPPHSQNSDR